MRKSIGWGIVGTGAVARSFAAALAATPDAARIAVASGKLDNARRFSRELGFARAHDDFAALAADRDVDIVYVASATRLHREHCLTALAGGKAVLCEKPFTGSLAQAEEVVAAARAAGLFCMEAMWLRFNTVIGELRTVLREGGIGEVAGATLSLGYAKAPGSLGVPADMRGATRVFGCYGLSLAADLFGPAESCRTIARRDGAGVDTDIAMLIGHRYSTTLIDASVSATRSNRLEIAGRDGIAIIPANLIDPATLEIRRHDRGRLGAMLGDLTLPLRERLPAARRKRHSGFRGEIAEAMRCLRAGLSESPAMPLDQTLAVQRLMAAVNEV